MGRTIGIDLGTTNSVVACVEQGRAETIINSEGSKTTPSIVLFGREEVLVGELAKRQAITNSSQVVRSAKRLMGRRFAEVAEEVEDFPVQVVEGTEGRAEIQLGDGRIIPPELAACEVLRRMRSIAEEYFDDDIDAAVITVPAYFNDAQRTATRRAAELADLSVLRIINEPTAAALAYGIDKQDRDEIIAVFDFGGGTFDISILQLQGEIFEVLATNGNTRLGGDNIDLKIFQEIRDGILQSTGIDPMGDLQAVSRIREAAEKTKIELSSLSSTHVSLPFIVADSGGPKHYEVDITRDQFEEWIEPLLQELVAPCQAAIADANLTPDRINEVLLVGGSTRIPRVQRLVEDVFGQKPNQSINPDEAVAIGASIQASVMRGDLADVLLLDITPLSLGIELAGGVFRPLIERNSSVPCEATRRFTTVVDNQTAVTVHVLQGERAVARENRTLATFRLTGIPPMPKELAEIEVTFRLDADGILEVGAIDLTTGQSTGVQVEGYGDFAQINKEEIEKIIEEARGHLDSDRDFVLTANRRAQTERLHRRVNILIEQHLDSIEEKDLKTLKESMLRQDLALANREWAQLDHHESLLNEILERYETYVDLTEQLGIDFEMPADREPRQDLRDPDTDVEAQEEEEHYSYRDLPSTEELDLLHAESLDEVPERFANRPPPSQTSESDYKFKPLKVKDGIVEIGDEDRYEPGAMPPPPPPPQPEKPDRKKPS